MLLFDIGANRGDAVVAGLQRGFDKIIALEPAPKMFFMLHNNFRDDHRVIPLKFAVSDSNDEKIEFYECVEDGLSTIEKSWLTGEGALYQGKAGSAAGGCSLFAGKQVAAKGWCSAYAKKA